MLLQIFEAEARYTIPVTILSPDRVVVVTWGVESRVSAALRNVTGPNGSPESLLFVPDSV